MKGVVLAAGKGSRLAELKLQHKSFALVHKKHVINYSLDLLVGDDEASPLVSEIIIVVGYNKEVIMEALGNSYRGVPVKYVVQHELKGIAHAVHTAAEQIDDDFVMCLADEILLNADLKNMIDFFNKNNASCACGVVIDGNDQSGKPIGYTVTETNEIVKVTEKPPYYENDIRGIGEVIFKKETLDLLPSLKPNVKRGELEMGDWIQMISDNMHKAYVCKLADAYVNVNYAKDIADANIMLGNN